MTRRVSGGYLAGIRIPILIYIVAASGYWRVLAGIFLGPSHMRVRDKKSCHAHHARIRAHMCDDGEKYPPIPANTRRSPLARADTSAAGAGQYPPDTRRNTRQPLELPYPQGQTSSQHRNGTIHA